MGCFVWYGVYYGVIFFERLFECGWVRCDGFGWGRLLYCLLGYLWWIVLG